jgi:hypothetical protein
MCHFPVQSLLQKRRRAFDNRDVETGIEIIKAIDAARWAHEQDTGCQCWQKALEDNPNPVQPQLVRTA